MQTIEYHKPKYHHRLFAGLIDILIISLPTAIIALFDPKIMFIFPGLRVLYGAFFLSSPLNATLGKRLMKIVVLSEDAQTLTFQKAFLREILSVCSLSFFFGMLHLSIFLNQKSQGFHDQIAGSQVFNGMPQVNLLQVLQKHFEQCIKAVKNQFKT